MFEFHFLLIDEPSTNDMHRIELDIISTLFLSHIYFCSFNLKVVPTSCSVHTEDPRLHLTLSLYVSHILPFTAVNRNKDASSTHTIAQRPSDPRPNE